MFLKFQTKFSNNSRNTLSKSSIDIAFEILHSSILNNQRHTTTKSIWPQTIDSCMIHGCRFIIKPIGLERKMSNKNYLDWFGLLTHELLHVGLFWQRLRSARKQWSVLSKGIVSRGEKRNTKIYVRDESVWLNERRVRYRNSTGCWLNECNCNLMFKLRIENLRPINDDNPLLWITAELSSKYPLVWLSRKTKQLDDHSFSRFISKQRKKE